MKPSGVPSIATAIAGATAMVLAMPALSEARPASGQNTYIVEMKAAPAATFEGTRPSDGTKLNISDSTVANYMQQLQGEHDAVAAAVGATKIYDYGITLNGFAAQLSEGQVNALRKRSDVLAVHPFKTYQLATDNTPSFIGVSNPDGPWRQKYTGEDIVVAILDGGIWPEHPCFEDRPTPIRGQIGRKIPYGDAPESFSGSACEFGNSEFNPADVDFACNNKLLSARFFVDGFLDPTAENQGLTPGECLSARDCGPFGDHGTNVAGTTACNGDTLGRENGEEVGKISGMAPRARIAHYKVCWSIPSATNGTCSNVDLVAAIEQAIADGVDVMNLSLGSSNPLIGDAFDRALLNATNAGIYVVTSAGNDGPGAGTVGSPATAPWVMSIGAMQDPGVTATGLEVSSPASIASTYIGLQGSGPVTLADAGDLVADVVVAEPLLACDPVTNGAALEGKIALVSRGACAFDTKYLNAQAAGAIAIVVYNDGADATRIDPIIMGGLSENVTIPGIMISFTDGDLIRTTAGAEPVAGRLSPDISEVRENRMASFSSRGPNGFTADILKPDVVAPGVQILSAGSPEGGIDQDEPLFSSINGTSFSSPHVAGLMALIRQAHPDWSPAAARSAYMTTGRQNIKETFREDLATPFDLGGGMVVPTDALDPGLVYDVSEDDYAAYSCGQNIFFSGAVCDDLAAAGFSFDPADLNYPAITISELPGRRTVRRTVTAVGGPKSRRARRVRYFPKIEAPEGFEVTVKPNVLRLREGESASFEVEIAVVDAPVNVWRFGSITWEGGPRGQVVRSPIAVKAQAISAPAEVDNTGAAGDASFSIGFGYTGAYTAQVHGLDDARPFVATVEDDPTDTFAFFGPGTTIAFLEDLPPGTAYARWTTFNSYTSGNDDIDLYLYYCPNFSCTQIASSGNSDSNESVDVLLPTSDPSIDDPYLVFAHGFNTEGGLPADLVLFAQDFGLVDDRGNMTISAPTSATSGSTADIGYSWSGLATGAGFKFLGAVSHSDAAGIQALTIVDIQNDEGFGLCDLSFPPELVPASCAE